MAKEVLLTCIARVSPKGKSITVAFITDGKLAVGSMLTDAFRVGQVDSKLIEILGDKVVDVVKT